MKKSLLKQIRSAILLIVITFLHSWVFAQVRNATVKVNKNITYQKITGYGGFVNSPQFGYNHMSETEIRKMWGPNSEAGYNIMRLYIPTGESNWAQVIPTAQLAKSLGLKIFASPWSMPVEWKTYNTIAAIYDTLGSRRTVSLKEANYADYANYLNNFVLLLRNNGVELDAISIQNEPDFQADYAGCIWSTAQITKFLKENRQLISCKVMAPESTGMSDNYANALNAADVLPKFDIYAGHQYGGIGSAFRNLQAQGKEAWMSEYLINWNANQTTGRDFIWTTDGFSFASALNDAMQANVNAWIHYATKRYYAMMGDGSFGIPASEITKRGRILSHYSKYVTGATRVQTTWNDNTSQLYGTSYLSVTGDSVFVVVNNNSVNTYNLAVDLPFLSNSGRAIRTTATENMIDTAVVFTVETNRPKVNIKPSSVTTLVFVKSGNLIPSQMTGEVINYTKIDSLTPTNSAFGVAYKLSGRTTTFFNNTPLISTNQNANNGYLALGGKFNRLVFRVESITSTLNYSSSNTTLYYINNADQLKTYNYGTVNFNLRSNFDWVIDISENVLTDGCKGVIGLTNGNFSSNLTMKFNNVYFAVGTEKGYKFTGPYSSTDGNLLDCLDDTAYTSLDFRNVTAIPSQTNWDSAATNKNCVYYVEEGSIRDKNNVVYAGTSSNLMLRDMGGNFYPPLGFTAAIAKYTATLNGYKMLVLPFQAVIPTGVNAYNIAFANARIEGTRIMTGSIPANTPVLVNGTGTFVFEGTGSIMPLSNPQVGITNAVYIGVKVPLSRYYLKVTNGVPSFSKSITTAQPFVSSFDAYLTLGADTTASNLQLVINDILPVTLGSFIAKQYENKVRLDWDTYTERNNDGFAIERSIDGLKFERIGFVKGKGNSIVQSWYNFVDNSPVKGINYYRLKQMDIDGSFKYSSVKSVHFDSKEPLVTLYPNPVKNILTIDGNGNKLGGTLVLSDATGRIVLQSNIAASNITRIDVSKLSSGIYFYRLNNIKGTFSKQ